MPNRLVTHSIPDVARLTRTVSKVCVESGSSSDSLLKASFLGLVKLARAFGCASPPVRLTPLRLLHQNKARQFWACG